MTWIKFALWLCGIYLAYYGGIIFWDIIRSGHMHREDDTHELHFVEHHEPERPEPDAEFEYFPSAITSSGGVNLKQLFNLAREEAIEYTRAVSFQ